MSRIVCLCAVLALGLVPLAEATCTPAELQTLLTTDADAIGFGPFLPVGNDAAILALANQVRPDLPYQIVRDRVLKVDVTSTFDPMEFDSLSMLALQRLTVILATDVFNFQRPNLLAILSNQFPAAPGTTRAALAALAVRQGSWAERRCGALLTLADLSFALRGTK